MNTPTFTENLILEGMHGDRFAEYRPPMTVGRFYWPVLASIITATLFTSISPLFASLSTDLRVVIVVLVGIMAWLPCQLVWNRCERQYDIAYDKYLSMKGRKYLEEHLDEIDSISHTTALQIILFLMQGNTMMRTKILNNAQAPTRPYLPPWLGGSRW